MSAGKLQREKPHVYAALRDGIGAIAEKVKAARPDYAAKGLSETRLQFDALQAARVGGDSSRYVCDFVYCNDADRYSKSGLDDTHLATALRDIFKALAL